MNSHSQNSAGELDHSVMKGNGYFFPAMGGVIEGQFENHYANGFCTVTFGNGDHYKGFLRNGQLHGKGIRYTSATNVWTYQIYENGKSIHELCRGDGEPVNIGL